MFRDIVKFKGRGELFYLFKYILLHIKLQYNLFFLSADSFDLICGHVETEAGIITVTCSTASVLTSFTCALDDNVPKNCELVYVVSIIHQCKSCCYI